MSAFERMREASQVESHPAPTPVKATPVASTPVADSPVALSGWITEAGEPLKADRHITPIARAQDALSRAEESIYDALWRKATERDGMRFAVIGFERLGRDARVTDKSAKASIRRLIEKQFIEVSRPAVIATRTPTEYRVFSYSDVLRRLSERGIGHVAKVSTGVFYALMERKATPVASACGNPESLKSTPVDITPVDSIATGVSFAAYPYENKKQEREGIAVPLKECGRCGGSGVILSRKVVRGIGQAVNTPCQCRK